MSLLGPSTSMVEALRTDVNNLSAEVTALTEAFNAFFDAVAQDLGYEAAKEYGGTSFGYFPPKLFPSSPRRLAETVTPEKREVVRRKTARCAGKRSK